MATQPDSNWVKGIQSLKCAEAGIKSFVEQGISKLHEDILNGLPEGASCSSCTTENIIPCKHNNNLCSKYSKNTCSVHDQKNPRKKSQPCPNSVCNVIRNEITKRHRFNSPTWRNTDCTRWLTTPWELAKCFMPSGYKPIKSASDTDLVGLLPVIILCKTFDSLVSENLSKRNNIFYQVRDVRNMIIKKPALTLTDQELQDCVNTVKQMLSDSKLTNADSMQAIIELDESLNGSVNSSKFKSTASIKDMETSTPSRQNSDETEYVSRFTDDFEHIQILGKGGFGVVFEVKNKVDEGHYAVKRIELPNSEVAKEKVMREVRALAKLSHVGIVRYYNSWKESPPTGWQEDKDKEIEQSECILSLTQLFSTTHNESSPTSSKNSLGSSPPKVINIPTQKKSSLLDFLQNPFGVNNLDNLEGSHSDCSVSKPRIQSRAHSQSLSRGGSKLTSEHENKTQSDINKKSVKDASTSKRSSSRGPKHYLYIQMQLCKRESLKDLLSSNTVKRDRHTVLDVFEQIVCAIEYVHDCGLMHRDLKPSNLFFSPEGVVKIGDFGLVTALPEEQNEDYDGVGNPYKHTTQAGTTLYMSPEQMSGKVYSQKVDIFSLGVILFELLYPFATQMERVKTLEGIKQQIFPDKFTREMAEECELIRLLLSEDPATRPTACRIRAMTERLRGPRM